MRQFHEGISSKTFSRDNSKGLRTTDILIVAIVSVLLSLSTI